MLFLFHNLFPEAVYRSFSPPLLSTNTFLPHPAKRDEPRRQVELVRGDRSNLICIQKFNFIIELKLARRSCNPFGHFRGGNSSREGLNCTREARDDNSKGEKEKNFLLII